MIDQQTVPLTRFTDGLSAVLRECFESRPAASGISNIAAEVNHTAFYLNVTLRFLRGEQPGTVDWAGSWQVGAVDEDQWTRLQDTLQMAYDALQVAVAQPATWAHPRALTGGIGMVAHCAYHLGEVRRTLGVIRG